MSKMFFIRVQFRAEKGRKIAAGEIPTADVGSP